MPAGNKESSGGGSALAGCEEANPAVRSNAVTSQSQELGASKNLAARGSSRARCGLLVHFSAPTVHPGWDGALVLEMINLGHAPVLLTPGMFIAQLIVQKVKGIPQRVDPSEFQGQSNPDGSDCSSSPPT